MSIRWPRTSTTTSNAGFSEVELDDSLGRTLRRRIEYGSARKVADPRQPGVLPLIRRSVRCHTGFMGERRTKAGGLVVSGI